MNDEENTIETLKRLVCEGAGVTAHTPGDFYAIAAYVEGRTHEGIGLTTVSDIVLGANIKNSDLAPGDRLMLRWNPGREVTAEYLGNSTFRIVSSVASKLAVGDTFQAALFAEGHPAMLANVIHEESSWPLYEIGQQGGLTLVRRLT